jgi:hypothetical protein
MKNRKLPMALLAALGMAMQSQAALYDITFSGGGYTASGQITVVASSISASGYTATSGYLDVTYGGNMVDYNYLAVSTDGTQQFSNNNGDNLPYGGTGNYVLPDYSAANPFLDANGLLFTTVTGHGGLGIYLSIDQYSTATPIPYNLNGYGNGLEGFSYDVPNVDGTATLVAVPEPAAMTKFAGGAALGLLLLAGRKKSPRTI